MKNTLSNLLKFDSSFTKSFSDHYFIGIDETGRGSLAGPVIACAFCWKNVNKVKVDKIQNDSLLLKLNDSKQVSKNDRKKIYRFLLKLGNFGIGYGSVLEIEKLNILNATFLAMKRAFENLILSLDEVDLNPYVLIDGNKFNPYINCRQLPIIGGDAKSSLIAGASIIAKVYRDELMHRVSRLKRYKSFGWRKNVGYGTPSHLWAIKKYGVTPLHRKLFVRKALGSLTFKKTYCLQ